MVVPSFPRQSGDFRAARGLCPSVRLPGCGQGGRVVFPPVRRGREVALANPIPFETLSPFFVIPAKAGTQGGPALPSPCSPLRGDDEGGGTHRFGSNADIASSDDAGEPLTSPAGA